MTESINFPRNGVTIGIPIYNEEKYIEAAIRSAAPQCEAVWVSDNASTDGSAAICERASREYHNVHFTQQPQNMGAARNFKFVLDKAETPYFMWLGGHDLLPDGYVTLLMQLLEGCPDAVLAYGAARHVDVIGKPAGNYDYSYHAILSDKSPAIRLLGLIRNVSNCSFIHGIFRTDVLRDVLTAAGADVYIGADIFLLGCAAVQGSFLYAPETYLIRRNAHPTDTKQDQLKRMDPCQLDSLKLTYLELQRRLYGLASSVSESTGFFGFLYRLKVRFILVKRFGPFGDTFLMRSLDAVLQFFARVVRYSTL